MMSRHVLGWILRLAVCVVGLEVLDGQALANIAAPTVELAFGGDPAAVQKTPLVVEGETLTMRCEGDVAAPTCGFEAVYALHNPTADTQRLVAAFYGVNTQVDRVALGDKLLNTRLMTAEEAAATKLPDMSSMGRGGPTAEDQSTGRTAFEVVVEPGANTKLVVTGAIKAGNIVYRSYEISAAKTRHLWLGESHPQRHFFEFYYLIAPIRFWGGAPPKIAFTLAAPSDWSVFVGDQASEPAEFATFTTTEAGDQIQITAQLDSAHVDSLRTSISTPDTTFNNGGIFIAAGGRADDSGGFRARAGYEVSIPEWMLYSLNLDTNFVDDMALALLAEAVTPSVFFIPSLGVGAGPVLQVLPEVQAGVRTQVSVHWPLLGFITSFDVFPGLATSDPLMFQATLLGQVGF